MTLFLVWHGEESVVAPDLRLALDRFELCPGLMLVDTELDLSPLYHRIKWALPAGSPLLVAPLVAAPKFKGMEQGAARWIRGKSAGGRSGTSDPT